MRAACVEGLGHLGDMARWAHVAIEGFVVCISFPCPCPRWSVFCQFFCDGDCEFTGGPRRNRDSPDFPDVEEGSSWCEQFIHVHPRCWCDKHCQTEEFWLSWQSQIGTAGPEELATCIQSPCLSYWILMNTVPMPSSSLNDVYVEICWDFALYFLFRHKKTSGAFATSTRLGVDRQIRENCE